MYIILMCIVINVDVGLMGFDLSFTNSTKKGGLGFVTQQYVHGLGARRT